MTGIPLIGTQSALQLLTTPPGARTKRRGDAGPVRLLLGGETHWPITNSSNYGVTEKRLKSLIFSLLSLSLLLVFPLGRDLLAPGACLIRLARHLVEANDPFARFGKPTFVVLAERQFPLLHAFVPLQQEWLSF